MLSYLHGPNITKSGSDNATSTLKNTLSSCNCNRYLAKNIFNAHAACSLAAKQTQPLISNHQQTCTHKHVDRQPHMHTHTHTHTHMHIYIYIDRYIYLYIYIYIYTFIYLFIHVCVCMHTTHICEEPTDTTFNASTNSMMSKAHGISALLLISTSGHSHKQKKWQAIFIQHGRAQ